MLEINFIQSPNVNGQPGDSSDHLGGGGRTEKALKKLSGSSRRTASGYAGDSIKSA
jgi:hypothetical protein